MFALTEAASEIAQAAVGDGELALEVGAVGFGLREMFDDGVAFWK